eukprot:TRINITY_DN8777_c0_g1_i1.p1 TRINITY_DN8777_c0_g1~~TRINITY_DN8777_c0_g1_i1.p1  ORF type:complete len:307 (-),score=87.79 TRINITY_DN8777_c0_g1_i1:32-952(-)
MATRFLLINDLQQTAEDFKTFRSTITLPSYQKHSMLLSEMRERRSQPGQRFKRNCSKKRGIGSKNFSESWLKTQEMESLLLPMKKTFQEKSCKLCEKERRSERRFEENTRERRLQAAGKKTKAMRDAERDVSEKIALGLHAAPTVKQTEFDQRLFNQTQGLDNGMADDDVYNVYDKPLFHGSSANSLYCPKKGDSEVYGSDSIEGILRTDRFKPDRDFDGVDRSKPSVPRSQPVEFERKQEEEDPFGLDEFLKEAKSNGKKSLDKIGATGHMQAASSSSAPSKSSKKRIEFDSSSASSSSSKKSKK